MAVATLAFVIAKIPINWKRICLLGTGLALSAYVVRLLPFPFGIHTILLIIILFLYLSKLNKGEFSISLISSLVSYVALVIFEIVCLSLLMPFFGVTPEILLTDSVIRILITLPQVLLIFISAFYYSLYLRRRSHYEFFNH